jgi:hypothetical protein
MFVKLQMNNSLIKYNVENETLKQQYGSQLHSRICECTVTCVRKSLYKRRSKIESHKGKKVKFLIPYRQTKLIFGFLL